MSSSPSQSVLLLRVRIARVLRTLADAIESGTPELFCLVVIALDALLLGTDVEPSSPSGGPGGGSPPCAAPSIEYTDLSTPSEMFEAAMARKDHETPHGQVPQIPSHLQEDMEQAFQALAPFPQPTTQPVARPPHEGGR